MGKPRALVYLDAEAKHFRDDLSPALRWLRSGFSVAVVQASSGLDRALQSGTPLVVVFCASRPDSVISNLRQARFPERVVLVAKTEELARLGSSSPAEAIQLVPWDETNRQFPRHACSGLIQTLLARCRAAIPKSSALADHPLLYDALRSLFILHPARPLESVNALAKSVGCTHRWLTEEWAKLWSAGEGHPHLTQLVKANLFMRAASLQLDGLPFWKCARLLGAGEDRLRGCYVQFTQNNPSVLNLDDLRDVIQKIEKEVFGWLLFERRERSNER